MSMQVCVQPHKLALNATLLALLLQRRCCCGARRPPLSIDILSNIVSICIELFVLH